MTNDQPKSEQSIPGKESDADLVKRLETLDDVMFPAIDGDPEALNASGPAWHHAVEELGIEAIQETRCEYLRHAHNVWQFLVHQSVQQPIRLLAVMKIIGMLMGDDV